MISPKDLKAQIKRLRKVISEYERCAIEAKAYGQNDEVDFWNKCRDDQIAIVDKLKKELEDAS